MTPSERLDEYARKEAEVNRRIARKGITLRKAFEWFVIGCLLYILLSYWLGRGGWTS